MKNNDAFNKIEDKIMDDILESIFAEHGEELLHYDFPTNSTTINVNFSDNYKNKKYQLIKNEQKKLKWKQHKKHYAQAVAGLIIILIIAGSQNTIVQAWWHKVLNAILSMETTHTKIDIDENNNLTFNAEGFYFYYIPDGFILNNSYDKDNTTFISFDNNNDSYFQFKARSVDALFSIDTENANVSNIKFKEHEALYSTNKNINILVWHDSTFSYTLAGNISKDDLIKIGENIEIEK